MFFKGHVLRFRRRNFEEFRALNLVSAFVFFLTHQSVLAEDLCHPIETATTESQFISIEFLFPITLIFKDKRRTNYSCFIG